MQVASMVIEEGGGARTINLCKLCHTAKLVLQGKQPLKSTEWKEVLETKAQILGNEYFTLRRACARKIFADAAQENQEGIHGQWHKESPLKEVLEQVKRSADTDCGAQTVRRAYSAVTLGNKESFKEECRKEGKLLEWTFERLQEACEKVTVDDTGGLSPALQLFPFR